MSTCADCKHWEKMRDHQGACRRYPPQVTSVVWKTYANQDALDPHEALFFNSTFPETPHDGWCGEWSEDRFTALSFG